MLSKIPPFRPRRDAHPDTEEEVRMSQIVESVKWPLNLKLIELKEVGFIERADLLKFIAGIHSDADGVTGAEIVRHLEAQHFLFSHDGVAYFFDQRYLHTTKIAQVH